MNYQAMAFWYQVVQGLATIGLALYVFLSNRQKATAKEIASLDRRIDSHDTRLEIIDERIKQMPHGKEVSAISVQLQKLDGDIRALREEMGGVRDGLKPFERTVGLMQEWLINNGSKR